MKAPPVMKTMRSASAGGSARQLACSSMPVISGIIRSHRMSVEALAGAQPLQRLARRW